MAQETCNTSTPRYRERGQDLVEFALVLPVLLLILIAVLDFGRAIYAYSVVANCAREGARLGIILADDDEGLSGADVDAIEVMVEETAVAISIDPSLLTINVTEPLPDTVRVQVDYTFELLTPLVAKVLGRNSLVLRTQATMYTGY
jgi:Flp pilus assembly protein TadG